MQLTRIIAIRHGETAWNVDTRVQGQLDIALNPHGLWQAQRAAQTLADEEIAAIYTSDLARAQQTASAIAALKNCPLQTHVGLRERGFGSFEGKTHVQIATESPDDAKRWHQREPTWAPPGGESLLVMRERVAETVGTMARAHPGQQIVVVAHGGVMDQLYRLATGQTLQAPRTWHLGNAAINRLLWTTEGFTLVGWGDVRHLDRSYDLNGQLQALDSAAATGCADVG
jgi:probable phosphoglycerate mutase